MVKKNSRARVENRFVLLLISTIVPLPIYSLFTVGVGVNSVEIRAEMRYL